VEDNLRRAASILTSEGAVAAYESMLRGGSSQTKFMGSAYFTKFLFFIGYQNPAVTGLRPLILDKRVVGPPTSAALRVAGAVPSPEVQLERLIAAFEIVAADKSRLQEERSRAKQVGLWLTGAPSHVAIGALTGAGAET
jgi:hypothetical protein